MKVCTECGRLSDVAGTACLLCNGALIPALDGSVALAIDPSEALKAGTKVGDYEIEKVIGQGGMGIVYGATHPLIGKRAAIKVLNARYCADHESVRRFMREAQAVNKIGHANIVDIFSIGELADGRSYLIMEWLQGKTLMDRIEREPLSRGETIAILIALTRALEAAHNAGVIHRDLKPENVILVPEDEGFRVKLLDFGIAKLETRRTSTRKTATGMTVGTPLYMSPEQAKGIAIDGRSDIYSLGILAYAMLCHTTPFAHEPSPVEVLHAHIKKPPRPPREIVKDIPPALETLILQMLAKRVEDRPPLAEIRRRLKAIDIGGFETFSTETPVPGRPHVSSEKPKWPLVIGAFGIVIALGAFAVVRAMQHDDAPRPATPIVATTDLPPRPSPQAAPGAIDLAVEPEGAAVKVDGQPIALANGRARIELPAGEHEVTTNAAGYRASAQTVAVTSAAVTPVTIKLVKQRAAAKKRPRQTDVDAVVDPFGRKKR